MDKTRATGKSKIFAEAVVTVNKSKTGSALKHKILQIPMPTHCTKDIIMQDFFLYDGSVCCKFRSNHNAVD